MRRAALLVALAVAGCGGGAPADEAARLVPADALVYVHASTDDGRLAERLEGFSFAQGLLDDYEAVRPWLGDEAAFALTARGPLLVLAVGKEAGAREYAEANGGELRGGFVVIGTPADGDALADEPGYADAEVSDDAVVRAWAAAGAADALGLPAVLGGRPVVADAALTDGGVRVRARRLGGAVEAADFEPQLLDGVPRDAFAYVGVRGLRPLGALLPEAAGAAAPEVAGALGPLLDALDGEVAVSVAPAAGAGEPVVTLLARVDDPAVAREAIAGLQGVIAAALTAPGEATGQVPVFTERDLGDGLEGYALTLAGGGELVYAVAGDRVAVSNTDEGVRRGLADEEGLAEAETFTEAITDVPDSAQALAFLAASQLLELADQAGLDASATYRAARADLARIHAVGAVVRRQEDDTTVELNLLIP